MRLLLSVLLSLGLMLGAGAAFAEEKKAPSAAFKKLQAETRQARRDLKAAHAALAEALAKSGADYSEEAVRQAGELVVKGEGRLQGLAMERLFTYKQENPGWAPEANGRKLRIPAPARDGAKDKPAAEKAPGDKPDAATAEKAPKDKPADAKTKPSKAAKKLGKEMRQVRGALKDANIGLAEALAKSGEAYSEEAARQAAARVLEDEGRLSALAIDRIVLHKQENPDWAPPADGKKPRVAAPGRGGRAKANP